MNSTADTRISTSHRQRLALVYARQSSAEQVRDNIESTRLQLGLREKAIAAGWKQPVVIDEDLGISAAGYAERPGFQRLLAMVAARQVGIIFCFDASRLSRNSKDWANLFELCGFFQTLIADLDQIYDLALPNDRLLLGIKGTIAEMELSIIKRRMKTGAEAKAARGELKFILPPGYVHDPDGKIVKDPDLRVQQAMLGMFDQFDRSSSTRQLALWYRDTKTSFPVRKVRKNKTISWEIPTVATLIKLIQHPIYAGTYVYGRRVERVCYRDGRLIKQVDNPLPFDKARVCIHDHHEPYITWERFLAIGARIADCRPRWKMLDNRGPLRDGLALLAGMLRCGRCGNKIRVGYRARSALYSCDGGFDIKGEKRCLSFGSKLFDLKVGVELCSALAPLALEAACLALDQLRHQRSQAVHQAELHVQAAQYEAERAFEQFDFVDPKNRLVADTLEERLNHKLAHLQDARARLAGLAVADKPLSPEQHRRIDQLAQDFPALWEHPLADPTVKKRILRTAIHEIVVTHDPDQQTISAVIHWNGGVHTRFYLYKRATPVGSKADPSLVDSVRQLAMLDDAEIARILNMKRNTTPMGLRWSKDRVRDFRKQHQIRTAKAADQQELLTGQQAAAILGISRHGLEALFRCGALHNHQVTDFAPWRIPRAEVESEHVRVLVGQLKRDGRLPAAGGCPEGQLTIFPEKSKAGKEGAL